MLNFWFGLHGYARLSTAPSDLFPEESGKYLEGNTIETHLDSFYLKVTLNFREQPIEKRQPYLTIKSLCTS